MRMIGLIGGMRWESSETITESSPGGPRTVNSIQHVKLASGLLLVLGVLLTIGCLALAFVSLFAFDAPGAMGSLPALGRFLALLGSPFLAAAAAVTARAALRSGSPRTLLRTLALLVIPAGVLSTMAVGMSKVTSSRPSCVAKSLHVPPSEQEEGCISAH